MSDATRSFLWWKGALVVFSAAIWLTLITIALVIGWIAVEDTPIVHAWFDAPPPPPVSTVTSDTFSFDNYGLSLTANKSLYAALQKLCPLGANKVAVDQLLVQHAGANIIDGAYAHSGVTFYVHKQKAVPDFFCPSRYWVIKATFDKTSTLQLLAAPYSGCPDDPVVITAFSWRDHT